MLKIIDKVRNNNSLHVLNCVTRLNYESAGLASKNFNKNFLTVSKSAFLLTSATAIACKLERDPGLPYSVNAPEFTLSPNLT